MTLILNEIHVGSSLDDTIIVAAADRRITNSKGDFLSIQRKLFSIPYLKGAISFFGLATVFPHGKPQYLSTWLAEFINKQSACLDMGTFAENLRKSLHQVIPAGTLGKVPSGFHICGYGADGLPDFWFLSNIGSMEGFDYIDLRNRYLTPSSHFLGRDARIGFNWNGIDRSISNGGMQMYTNGDIRVQNMTWRLLDQAFYPMFQEDDFKNPTQPEEYGKYVQFKFEIIAFFYKRWAKKIIISRPIDILVLRP